MKSNDKKAYSSNVKPKILPLGLLLAVAIVFLIVNVTFAVLDFYVEENYEAESATNSFTLEDGDSYYASYPTTQDTSNVTINVKNNIINAKYENPFFDLVVNTSAGISASIEGLSARHETVKNGDEEVYIFTRIAHSSPSSTGSMAVNIVLNGATTDEIRVAVLTHSNKNNFIKDFFDLKMANNEELHNIVYENGFGNYETIASGTYTIDDTSFTISNVGTVNYPSGDTSANLTGTISEEGDQIIFKISSATFTSGLILAGADYYRLYLSEDGWYYNEQLALRVKLDDASGVGTLQTIPYETSGSYKNIYLIDDLTIDEDFVLNIPCYFNLLFSNIYLEADFLIKHPYGGSFTIVSASENTVVDNTSHTFTIDTPRAYYTTLSEVGGIEGFVTNSDNFLKRSENIKFLAPENAELLSALLDDARAYIKEIIPTDVWENLILPTEYQLYGVTYSYSSSNPSAFSALGNVNRSATDVNVDLSVTVHFNGATVGEVIVLPIRVVGTSEESSVGYVVDYLQENIDVFSNRNNYLMADVELFTRTKVLFTELNCVLPIRVESGGDTYFYVKYIDADEEKNVQSHAYTLDMARNELIVHLDTDLVIDFDDIYAVWLKLPETVLSDTTEKLTFRYGYSQGEYAYNKTVNYTLCGLTFEEKTNYLERYLEDLYVTSTNTASEVIRLGADGFYRGSTSKADKIIDSTLDATAVDYGFYAASSADVEALNEGSLSLEEVLAKSSTTFMGSYFTVNDGSVTSSALKMQDDKLLIMTISFTFDGGTENERRYQAYRRIIIPEEGIGGSDYTEYTRGDTFSEYFDSLNNGRLIDSTADKDGESGTAYEFMPFESGVYLEMNIENLDDVKYDGENYFCTLVRAARGYYQIDIDVDNVPSHNTIVQLAVRFYLQSGSVQTTISEQSYSFTIPGIYKAGRDVASEVVYKRMLEVYENFNDTYLLVDGANDTVTLFDCSFDTLEGVQANDIISLEGIELLTDTAKMIFDGVKVESLSPFGNFSTHNLTSLSMRNCGIGSDLFAELKDGERSYLYRLNRLAEVDFSYNSITSLNDENGKSCLYRTIEVLRITNQSINGNRCFDSLEGITALNLLSILDVSGNAIADFGLLERLTELTELNVSDNVTTDFGSKKAEHTDYSFYGSSGKINIPVFVALSDRGVALTGDASSLFTESEVALTGDASPLFTESERIASLAINAVVFMSTHYDSVTVPTTTYLYSTGATNTYDLVTEYIIYNGTACVLPTAVPIDDEKASYSGNGLALNGNSELKVILSVCVDDATVYKQFSINYKESE